MTQKDTEFGDAIDVFMQIYVNSVKQREKISTLKVNNSDNLPDDVLNLANEALRKIDSFEKTVIDLGEAIIKMEYKRKIERLISNAHDITKILSDKSIIDKLDPEFFNIDNIKKCVK